MLPFQDNFNIELHTPKLILRVANSNLIPNIVDYCIRNKEHFSEHLVDDQEIFFSSDYQTEKLWFEFNEMLEGRGIRFYIFLKEKADENMIIGDVSLSHISLFGTQSGILGYKIDKDYAGKGLMKEALECAIKYIFQELVLHRIVCYIEPSNIPSLKLCEKLGFVQETLLKEFILINSVWLDHYQYSLINPISSFDNK